MENYALMNAKDFKNLHREFGNIDSKYYKFGFNLDKLSLWDKSELLNAYYTDDNELFVDALIDKDNVQSVFALLDITISEANQTMMAKTIAIEKLWASSSQFIQGYFDEWLNEYLHELEQENKQIRRAGFRYREAA